MEPTAGDVDELVEFWTLLDEDRELLGGNRGASSLGFALLLKHYKRIKHAAGADQPSFWGKVVLYLGPARGRACPLREHPGPAPGIADGCRAGVSGRSDPYEPVHDQSNRLHTAPARSSHPRGGPRAARSPTRRAQTPPLRDRRRVPTSTNPGPARCAPPVSRSPARCPLPSLSPVRTRPGGKCVDDPSWSGVLIGRAVRDITGCPGCAAPKPEGASEASGVAGPGQPVIRRGTTGQGTTTRTFPCSERVARRRRPSVVRCSARRTAGAGHPTIAANLDRPASTVRRALRGAATKSPTMPGTSPRSSPRSPSPERRCA